MNNFKIISSFENGEKIPQKYTCEGENIFPPLNIENAPEGTKSFALIIEDPDAPGGVFRHLIAYNLPKNKITINEGEKLNCSFLKNDFGKKKYLGPCPPKGTHRYYFRLYALNSILKKDKEMKRDKLFLFIRDHLINEAVLMGTYSRK